MEAYNKQQSVNAVKNFIGNVKKSNQPSFKVEYFDLTRDDNNVYEKSEVAYIQAENGLEGLLYEALLNDYFYLKAEDSGSGSFSRTVYKLTKDANPLVPENLRKQMFWVCSNKTDAEISLADIRGNDFTLTKPN